MERGYQSLTAIKRWRKQFQQFFKREEFRFHYDMIEQIHGWTTLWLIMLITAVNFWNCTCYTRISVIRKICDILKFRKFRTWNVSIFFNYYDSIIICAISVRLFRCIQVGRKERGDCSSIDLIE